MRPFFRSIWTFIIGLVVGVAIGLAAGLIVFPFVFAPPPATEQRSEADQAPLASGAFVHADPSDPAHWGQGGVTLFDRAVFLEPDFKVGPGPQYHVYLSSSSAEDIRNSADKNQLAAQGLGPDLGRLRSFEGSQRYEIPPGENLSNYMSVTVWCQAFNVLITVADLKKPGV
jgi:hypothetical protein